jgi:enoyl reductase-like protein
MKIQKTTSATFEQVLKSSKTMLFNDAKNSVSTIFNMFTVADEDAQKINNLLNSYASIYSSANNTNELMEIDKDFHEELCTIVFNITK